MYTLPLYKFNFVSGLQIFESTYQQYLENDLLTIMHTDRDKSIITNYKLNDLTILNNNINENDFHGATHILLDLAKILVDNHMTYLCNADKILKIILEDDDS